MFASMTNATWSSPLARARYVEYFKSQTPRRSHRIVRATVLSTEPAAYEWKGADDFTHWNDRKAEPPLPLPPLTSPKRIVLVRHGQSTWNAEGRIQGSTDFAVLSAKGCNQAQTTCQMVRLSKLGGQGIACR
jgi:hypothetical protein